MKANHYTSICPFCEVSIQNAVFYTSGNFMAIYNIAPVLPGHSLVIPGKHCTSILELSNTELSAFFETARTTLLILMKAFRTDSFDWSVQEKPEAGQTIEHLHLHIVPRLKGDLKHPGEWYPLIQHNDEAIMDSANRTRLEPEALKQIVKGLRLIAADL